MAIQVSPAAPTIAQGSTQQFTAIEGCGDGTTQDVTATATWSSSSAAVATITSSGLAFGNAPGSTTITATLDGVTGAATLTVSSSMSMATLVSITVTPATSSLAVGTMETLVATGVYSGGGTSDLTHTATWSSSSSSTASVAADVVTGVFAGTATITATSGAVSGTASVTVTPAVLVSCAVEPSPSSMGVTVEAGGPPVDFVAIGFFSDGTTHDLTATSIWTSGTPAVAAIGAMSGIATPLTAGTSVITSTSPAADADGGAPITCSSSLIVQAAPALVSITVTPPNPLVIAGATQQFTATGTYADNTTQNLTSRVSWTSGSLAIAAVAPGGLATGLMAGASVITATLGTVSGNTTLTVTAPTLVSLTIFPSRAEVIPPGSTLAFFAIGTYSDGSQQDLSSAATFNATPTGTFPIVTFAANIATAKFMGIATVTASLGGVTSNSYLIQTGGGALVELAITPATPAVLHVGAPRQFTATVTYADGQAFDATTMVAWTSSTPSVATVAATGRATGVAAGTTAIGAAIGNTVATPVNLTVSPATLVSIAVTPSSAHLAIGATLQLTATATYTDGSTGDVTQIASWASSTPSDFTVNGTGLVTGIASTGAGQTKPLVASIGSISGVAQVAVTSATLSSIKITCLSPNAKDAGSIATQTSGDLTCLPAGVGLQLDCVATGTYNDGSTGDITATAAWHSSALVTAFPTGLTSLGTGTQPYETFTINAAGSSNITATQGTIVSNTITTSGVTESLNLSANQCAGSGALALLGPTGACSPGTIAAGTSDPFSVVASYTTTGACTGAESELNVTSLATWRTLNQPVATVSNAAGSIGLVTGVGVGTTTLSASFGGQAGTFSLTVVTPCLESATVVQSGSTYPIDVEIPLTVNAVFNGVATLVALTPATFASYFTFGVNTGTGTGATITQNTSVLFVNAGTAAGNPVFTATALPGVSCAGNVTATLDLTTDGTTLPTSVAITPANEITCAGNAVSYAAMAAYGAPYNASYAVAQDPVAGWTMAPAFAPISFAADPSSMGVTQSNALTASGSFTVNFAYRGLAAHAGETFTACKGINGITITGANIGSPTTKTYARTGALGVPGDLPVQFTVGISYTDGTTSTSLANVTFTSSVPSVLPNPNASGVATTITPTASTTTEVTATVVDPTDNKVWTSPPFPILVNTATCSSLAFAPAAPLTMPESTSDPLAITGDFSNGQTFDVSALVTSSSADATIVAVTTTATGTELVSGTKAASTSLTFGYDMQTATYGVTVSGM